MQRNVRLNRELSKITVNPPPGITFTSLGENLDRFEACISGPENTPYERGVFFLEILVPANYPFSPPCIKFMTKIYHPNIDDTGRICLDILKMPPSGCWKPTIGIENILTSVRMLLQYPNPEDPLMVEIAEEFKNDHEQFVEVAKSFTQKYALHQ